MDATAVRSIKAAAAITISVDVQVWILLAMTTKHKTLTHFLVEQQYTGMCIPKQLGMLIEVLAGAGQSISNVVKRGAVNDLLGDLPSENVQGEVQNKLDSISDDFLLEASAPGSHLAALASEEMDMIRRVPNHYSTGQYLLVYDQINGSGEIDANGVVGTIFSVLRTPNSTSSGEVTEQNYPQPGYQQASAGYAAYGAQTVFWCWRPAMGPSALPLIANGGLGC